jgi:plasmid stabilization system protein ParE
MLARGDQRLVTEFVSDNSGSEIGSIASYLSRKSPSRAKKVVRELSGETIRSRDGGFYPVNE